MISSKVVVAPREPGFNGNLIMGKGAQIGPNSIVDLCADITIEDEAIVGPNCVLYTHNHDYRQADGSSLGKTPALTSSIHIGKNTWIGTNVIILPGVKIGENSMITAGAVVTKDVPSNVLAGGVPAKVIRSLR